MDSSSEINFMHKNPGAVKYGNFINYYNFHPAQNRINLFPKDIWTTPKHSTYVCLDIGCNTGELTISLLHFLQENTPKGTRHNFLGIDLDTVLIQRALEANTSAGLIEYSCTDFMNEGGRKLVRNYLQKFSKTRFDITFCLSITMWIHLNHGDDGLKRFLQDVCDGSEMVVIEPQPWKCYKTAVKRFKQANSEFPFFKDLKYRLNVETFIKEILEEYSFVKITETPLTSWGRKILFYKRKS